MGPVPVWICPPITAREIFNVTCKLCHQIIRSRGRPAPEPEPGLGRRGSIIDIITIPIYYVMWLAHVGTKVLDALLGTEVFDTLRWGRK